MTQRSYDARTSLIIVIRAVIAACSSLTSEPNLSSIRFFIFDVAFHQYTISHPLGFMIVVACVFWNTFKFKDTGAGRSPGCASIKAMKPCISVVLFMSVFKEQLVNWSTALSTYDKGDSELALIQFEEFADMSKLHFNVGMIAMELRDTEQAVLYVK